MGKPCIHITDHALLRYLERAHGVDVEALRRKLAGHAAIGIEYGAAAVIVGSVKLVLVENTVTTVLRRNWYAGYEARLNGDRRGFE